MRQNVNFPIGPVQYMYLACQTSQRMYKVTLFVNEIVDYHFFFLFDCLASGEECPSGQEYIDCVECERECSNLHLSCRQGECSPGCGCPEGTVRQEGICIPQEQCPCYYNGKSYNTYESLKKDCNQW